MPDDQQKPPSDATVTGRIPAPRSDPNRWVRISIVMEEPLNPEDGSPAVEVDFQWWAESVMNNDGRPDEDDPPDAPTFLGAMQVFQPRYIHYEVEEIEHPAWDSTRKQ